MSAQQKVTPPRPNATLEVILKDLAVIMVLAAVLFGGVHAFAGAPPGHPSGLGAFMRYPFEWWASHLWSFWGVAAMIIAVGTFIMGHRQFAEKAQLAELQWEQKYGQGQKSSHKPVYSAAAAPRPTYKSAAAQPQQATPSAAPQPRQATPPQPGTSASADALDRVSRGDYSGLK
jgi:hypothetical protein